MIDESKIPEKIEQENQMFIKVKNTDIQRFQNYKIVLENFPYRNFPDQCVTSVNLEEF